MIDLQRLGRFSARAFIVLSAGMMAGCMAGHQAKLDGAAPPTRTLAGQKSVGAAPGAPAGQKLAEKNAAPSPTGKTGAGAVMTGETIVAASMSGPASAPLPAQRPDFGDRVQVAEAGKKAPGNAQVAGQTSNQPVTQPNATGAIPNTAQSGAAAPVQVASAAPVAPATRNSSWLVPNPPRMPGLPGYEQDDPEPPLSPTAERLERSAPPDYDDTPQSSLAAAAPVPPQRPQSQASGPAIVTTAAYAPAVVEVNGVANALGSEAGHKLIRTSLSAARPAVATGSGVRYWRAAYPHVVTHCFGRKLRTALNMIGRHYGREVQVTSGHRARGRRRSMHRFCRAADIRVPGVRPSRLARFARSIPGINGVGTYRRKSIVHIDTRLQEMVWRY